MADELALAALQRWMLAVITHPDGVDAGLLAARETHRGADALERELTTTTEFPARERLEIYANAHWAHLLSLLAREFPVVEQAMGRDAFRDLATQFLAAHPRCGWRLSPVGAEFVQFIAEARDQKQHGFLTDLARFERAVDEVFDEPAEVTVDPSVLEALSPQQWANARFAPIAALRLLELEYPIERYFEAVVTGEPAEIPVPAPCYVVVWRRVRRVWRAEIDSTQYAILAGLCDGNPLEAALAAGLAAGDFDQESLLGALSEWFAGWTSDGIFRAVNP